MSKKQITAPEMLDREFLGIRCRLLDIAAALDRIDARDPSGTARHDPRYEKIAQAITALAAAHPHRAEQVQMLFSDSYDAGWVQSSHVSNETE